MKFVSISLFLYFCIHQSVNTQQTCTTPDRKAGQCVQLSACPSLNSLYQKKNITHEERLFLSRSLCATVNVTPWVCCGPQIRVATTPTPPAVVVNKAVFNAGAGLLPTPGVCGIHTSDKIYGGTETKVDEYPWTVLLEYSKPNNLKGFHCGGVLINDRYVLTASHCVNGKDIPKTWQLTSVRLGEWDTTTETDCDTRNGENDCSDPIVDVAIAQKIPHESYNPQSKNQFNDIALLRLSRKITYTDYIKPVCLPRGVSFRNKDYSTENYDVAGWGKTEFKSKSNIKLKVDLDGVTKSSCNTIYNKQNVQISDDQICAGGEEGKDSCRGDSGGPLMAKATTNNRAYVYLAGLVSYGPTPCGMLGFPGVYTKVASYIDWIESKVEA